jgi:hypothetical protein
VYLFGPSTLQKYFNKNMANYTDCKKLRISDLIERDMFYIPKTVVLHWPQLFFMPMTDYLGDFAMTGLVDGNKILVAYYGSGCDLLGQPKKLAFVIHIVKEAVHFGGYKRYFLCPLCKRMCSVLYKPDSHDFFGCNECHHIRYPTQVVNQKHSAYAVIRGSMAQKRIDKLEVERPRRMYAGRKTRRAERIEKLYRFVGK